MKIVSGRKLNFLCFAMIFILLLGGCFEKNEEKKESGINQNGTTTTNQVITTTTFRALSVWTGESTTDRAFRVGGGDIIKGSAYEGEYAINFKPDIYSGGTISLANTSFWRMRLTEYDEVWFYAKTDNPGCKIEFCILGWDQVSYAMQLSNKVDISKYIEGTVSLSEKYKLVKIPVKELKSDKWDVNCVETLFFKTNETTTPSIYIDKLSFVKTVPPEGKIADVYSVAKNIISIDIKTGPDKEDIPSTNIKEWKINGELPIKAGRYSFPYDEYLDGGNGSPMEHHIYLELPKNLISGNEYLIETPYGSSYRFHFDDKKTICESIKINQEGYNDNVTEKYAVFGIYEGDLGSKKLDEIYKYKILSESTNTVVDSGEVKFLTDDTAGISGEYTYKVDLSKLKTTGKYFISIEGVGRSYSFGVGKDYSKKIADVAMRGMYHQRCGIALEKPYTEYTRGVCHTKVSFTNTSLTSSWIKVASNAEMHEIHGGYHDAGDFDRRPMHTIIPVYMLNYFEMQKSKFYDKQYNIPDMFDSSYNTTGSGNGIPDFLDEALWGVLLYEYLQQEDGSVMSGTEASGHPGYGAVSAETDKLVYGTWNPTGHVCASACGMFAQSSRLLKEYNSQKAKDLLVRGEKAWDFLFSGKINITGLESQLLYASLQMYLATATGNSSTDAENKYHKKFIEYVDILFKQNTGWPRQFKPGYLALGWDNEQGIFLPYFISYILFDGYTDSVWKEYLKNKIINGALNTANELEKDSYPVGLQKSGWASATGQGWSADILIAGYMLSNNMQEKNRFYNLISRLADYNLGLNPLGRSYITGLGINQPKSTCHLDSFYTKYGKGDHLGNPIGNVPGIVVYGPLGLFSGLDYNKSVWEKIYPEAKTAPSARRYCDGWSWISANEFTTWETIIPNVIISTFLEVQ